MGGVQEAGEVSLEDVDGSMNLVPGDITLTSMNIDLWSMPSSMADYVTTASKGELFLIVATSSRTTGAWAMVFNQRALAWVCTAYLVNVE